VERFRNWDGKIDPELWKQAVAEQEQYLQYGHE